MSRIPGIQNWVWRAIILACIFVAPFLRFLLRSRYGLFHLEVFAGLALFAGLCVLLAIVCRRPAWFYVTVLLSAFAMSAGTATLVVQALVAVRVRWILPCLFGGLLAAMWLMRERFFRVLAIFVIGAISVDVAGALFSREKPARGVTQSLPAGAVAGHVIYLIFDESLGLAGLSNGLPECEQARRELEAVLLRNHFEAYPYAFSNYWYTFDSVPSILNLRLVSRSEELLEPRPEESLSEQNRMRENRLFAEYRAQGYQIAVYQSDALNVCPPDSGLEPRLVYKAHDVRTLEHLPISWRGKFIYLVSAYLRTDRYLSRLLEGAQWRLPGWDMNTGPFGAAEVWPDRLLSDILRADRKTLFFAHLLTPHYPYVYRRAGLIRDYTQWGIGLMETGDPAQYALRYRQYGRQVRYVAAQLGRFLDALRKTGAYSSSLIVIHGDHGSRLQLTGGMERGPAGTARNRIDKFSTLLAIKRPASEAGSINSSRASVLRILTGVFDPEAAKQLPEAVDCAYEFDSGGAPVPARMIDVWEHSEELH